MLIELHSNFKKLFVSKLVYNNFSPAIFINAALVCVYFSTNFWPALYFLLLFV